MNDYDIEWITEPPIKIRVLINNQNNLNRLEGMEFVVPGNYSDEEIGEAVRDLVLRLLNISWIEVNT